MRHPLGIALGAAALAGLAGASLASPPAGPPAAMRLTVPAAAFGRQLLGSPPVGGSTAGLAPVWLLLRTLPDGTRADGPAVAGAVALAPAPAAVPAPSPLRTSAPLPALLASMPVQLPLRSLPVVPTLPLPPPAPPSSGPGAPGAGHHGGTGNGSGSGSGHGHHHGTGHPKGSPPSPASPSSGQA